MVGLTEQLHVLSTVLAAPQSASSTPVGGAASFALNGGTPPSPLAPPRIALPARRDVGLTVSQVDRLSGAVGQSLAKSAGFQQAVRQAPTGARASAVPDLFSDDATSGYRVDVSMDGGPFRSLMRRHIT